MNIIFTLLWIAVVCRYEVSGAPPIPIWGGSVAFTVDINVTNPADGPSSPLWNFHYSYFDDKNGNQTLSLYETSQGNADEACVGIPGSPPVGTPCNIIHSSNDNWMYVQFYDKQTNAKEGVTATRLFCCACTRSLGAVSSTWLIDNSNTSYMGVYRDVDAYNLSFVPPPVGASLVNDRWLLYANSDNNYYSAVDVNEEGVQLPVRFNEYKHGQLKQWDFQINTYVNKTEEWVNTKTKTTQDNDDEDDEDKTPNIFDAPENCDNLCHGICDFL